jgi:hypothetical protein
MYKKETWDRLIDVNVSTSTNMDIRTVHREAGELLMKLREEGLSEEVIKTKMNDWLIEVLRISNEV